MSVRTFRKRRTYEAMPVSEVIECIDKKDFTGAIDGLDHCFKTGVIGSNVGKDGKSFLMISDGDHEQYSRNEDDWLLYDINEEGFFIIPDRVLISDYESVNWPGTLG